LQPLWEAYSVSRYGQHIVPLYVEDFVTEVTLTNKRMCKKGATLDKICTSKIAGRGLRRAKQPQGKGFRVLGDTRPRVPRQQVRHKTKLSLQDELFTWYGGVI